jgi:exopolysaccharide production protein ExoZ
VPGCACGGAALDQRRWRVLYNLHLLRVIAALGVVYFHATSTAGLKLDWDIGSRGVDIFFVISGFIIAYIGTGKPQHFFRRRLIRVVPFYWGATLVVFSVALVAPHLFHTTTASVPHLASSLAFIPRLNTVTGEMMPTLVLGWSLNFEMFFYVVFALALLISPQRAPLFCVAWIILFYGAIHMFATRSDIMNFYARPIVLEFCYGVLVYYIFRWVTERKAALEKVAVLKYLLMLVFVGGLVTIAVLEHVYGERIPRHLAAGIPAFFIVLSALLLERLFAVSTSNRTIYLLGEASYIIYLVHPYIVFTVLRLFVKNAALGAPALAVLIVGLLALTSAIAVAIHVWFEKPVMAYLRAKLT